MPTTPLNEIADILDKYEAEYIAINGRIPPDILALYWKPDLDAARVLIERLRRSSPAFELLYGRDNIALFRYDSRLFERGACMPSEPLPFLGDSIVAPDLARCKESGQQGILIEDVRLSRDRVRRGDTLQVNITWVAAERQPFRRYMAHLRFDTGFMKNALYRESYGKLYRKALERMERVRYRFRVDFLPMGGIYAPDTWSPLREIHESVTVAVPPDVVPGAYTISLKMGITPQFPNYHMGDFFIDHDYFSGAVVGHATIE